MFQTIIGGVFGLFGVALGWLINILTERYLRKPKLCFDLQPTSNQDDLIPYEFRTKTSESGYGIEIYNIGKEPIFLSRVRLYYRNTIIVDCFTMNQCIMPYEKIVYELTMQDISDIKYHCREHNINQCKIIAYDVSGKKSKRCNGFMDRIAVS